MLFVKKLLVTNCCAIAIMSRSRILLATPITSYGVLRDAAMHSDCFMAWDKRAEFVRLYNDTMGKLTWGNGTYHRMEDDGRVNSLIR